MAFGNIAEAAANSACDSLGNLLLDTSKNKRVDYMYNQFNRLVKRPPLIGEVIWMFKNASLKQKVILVIVYILWIPMLGAIGYGIYLDLQPPPPLSPMQKQTERYAHNFGFPWQNVYVDAVGISDWCYHEKWGRIQTDHYYYEVVTSDQTPYLILVGYDPLAIYEELHDGQSYRLIGDTAQTPNDVLEGVADLKGTTVDELRELYGYRCLSIYPSRSEKLPAA